MRKTTRRILTAAVCCILLATFIIGCSQQEKSEPPINETARDATALNSLSAEDLPDTIGASDSDASGGSDENKESAEVQFTFYPSGRDFIKSIIDKRGSVKITDEMRDGFNLFARDYRWCYLPDTDGYESFFETTHYADSFGYPNFADAVFYVLQYMKCPEKLSAEAMQSAIQDLFVAKDSSDKDMPPREDMPHQAYPKFAKYEDGFYSPWPEGGLDHNKMFYLLTGLDIVQDGSHVAYITVHGKSYYFNDSEAYEAGDNEKWLAEKSEEMGVSDLEAAAKLIANGKIKELKGDSEFETTIYIKFSGRNPYGYYPRFISNQSQSKEG